MNTRSSNEIIDYIVHEYIDEQGRIGNPYSEEALQDVMTDLLTDIRHYSDARGLDFDLAHSRSALHKAAESP